MNEGGSELTGTNKQANSYTSPRNSHEAEWTYVGKGFEINTHKRKAFLGPRRNCQQQRDSVYLEIQFMIIYMHFDYKIYYRFL